MVAMEMSKSPKPRHFSDSSRERRDKNRHGRRTKSYLKEKMSEEDLEGLWEKNNRVTHVVGPRVSSVLGVAVYFVVIFVLYLFFSQKIVGTEQTRFSIT